MPKIVSLNRVVSAATVGVFALVMVISVGGQTRRPRPRPGPAAPKPTASPTPTAQPSSTPASEALATVNGQTISAADIENELRAAISQDGDPYLRAFFEDPDKEIAEARRRALDARINSLLVAAEAKKQKKTVEEFRDMEIESRIAPPTEEEIGEVYEANRRTSLSSEQPSNASTGIGGSSTSLRSWLTANARRAQ